MKKITLIMMCFGMFVLLNAQIPSVLTESDFSTKSGTVTDARDGKTYAYKQYGDYYWFMQNLNWDGTTTNGEGEAIGSTVADDEDGAKYGRFYNKTETNNNPCPEGWTVGHFARANNSTIVWPLLMENILSEYETGMHINGVYDLYNVAPYVKAGGIKSEDNPGGLWDGTVSGEINEKAAQIQFNMLPASLGTLGLGKVAVFRAGISGSNDERYHTGATGAPHANTANIKHNGAANAAIGAEGSIRCLKKVLPEDEAAVKNATTDYSTAKDYIDPRSEANGRTYKIKEYGGKEWFVENLNFPAAESATIHPDPDGDVYGRFYPGGANAETKAGWCPPGWRVSTTEDWDDLLTYLKSTYSLNDTQLASALIGGMGASADVDALWLSQALGYEDNNRSVVGFNILPASYVKDNMATGNAAKYVKYYYPMGNGRGTSGHFIQDGISHRYITNASTILSGDFENTFASVRCVREKTNKEPQLIQFSIPAKTNVGDELEINVTSSSGLTIDYQISDPAIAEITGNVLKIKAEGTVTITANQAGNEEYDAAIEVAQTTVAYPTPSGLEAWVNCPADLLKKDFSTAEGLLTDARDGKQYAYKQYGEFFWFMQNLNWDGAGSAYNVATNEDGKHFGRFYSTAEANNAALSLCPEGWKVARYEEWRNFSDYLIDTYELDINYKQKPESGNDGYRFNNLLKYVKGGGLETEGGLWKLGNINAEMVDVIQFNMLPSGAADGTSIGTQTSFVMGKRSYEDRFYTGTNTTEGHQDYFDNFRHASGGTGNIRCVKSSKQEQSITFPDFPEFRVDAPDLDPGATASSGLTVTYESADDEIATIVDNKIHAVKAGTVMITAKQEGDATYQAAANVVKQLTILPRLDTESPTTPTNLRTTEITKESVSITWDESTDNVEVAGYNIYKDNQFVVFTPTNSIRIGKLTPNTTYKIEVEAQDEAGNKSGKADITVKTEVNVGFDSYSVKDVVIYPNPVEVGNNLHLDNLPVNLSDNAVIRLYNLSGQLLKTEKVTKDMKLPVESPGIYILEFVNYTDKEYFRLIAR